MVPLLYLTTRPTDRITLADIATRPSWDEPLELGFEARAWEVDWDTPNQDPALLFLGGT